MKFRLPLYYDAPDGDTASATAVAEPAPPAAHPDGGETSAPAAKEPAPSQPTNEHGPVPFERHHAILSTTRQEYEDKIKRIAWAEGLDAKDVRRALDLADMVERRDPRLVKHLTAQESARPEPDAKDERGEPFYTAAQAAKLARWEAEQIKHEIEQRYAPIAETFESQQERQDAVVSQLEQAQTWPDFEKHISTVTQLIGEARAKGAPITLFEAYTQARIKAEVSGLEPNIRKQILAELNQTNTVAKDDVNPNRVASASRKDIRDMDPVEAVREVRKELTAKRKAS